MAYGDTDGLALYIGQERYDLLTDRDDDDAEDAGAGDAALDSASSFADSYIAAYLPIATAPDALVHNVYDIAVYALSGNDRTDDERLRYEDAIRWLRDIAAGRATLAPPEGGEGDGVLEVDAPEAEYAFGQTTRML